MPSIQKLKFDELEENSNKFKNSNQANITNILEINVKEEVITSDKLTWLYDAPIEVIRLENQLFVIHKKSGTNVHVHNHSSC